MTVIGYFSVIAIVVSAISLFGILFSVMPERMKSLDLIRKIGCSKRRVAVIILMEWLFLLICGIAIGTIAGIAIYEFVLWIQNAPVILPLIVVSLALIILSAAVASILLRRKKGEYYFANE